ncbi:MAG TPA: hypothetical protein VG322_09155 [Candidatus Acidoferrales bacterium]|nr:hypothetical protein [Candidatus Acidoferrales bacterium]
MLRSEELQGLDGDTNAVLYDSASFTNFTAAFITSGTLPAM